MRKALAIYAQPELFRRYRRNAMKADFSWEHTVEEYVKIYELISSLH
jgi:glycogen synthase